jgi:PAS domain S-box-containing protein
MKAVPPEIPEPMRPAERAERDGGLSPFRLFFITITCIFVAEIFAMALVSLVPTLAYSTTTLIDAGIMVILIFPILYIFSFRPLIQHIRKLQQVERALHEKEELQERFFDSTGVLIAYMDRDFNFIQVNDAFAGSAVGRTPEFFLGQNQFVLFPDVETRAIFQKVVDTGKAHSAYEKPFAYLDHPEGGAAYWNWSLQPVRGVEGRVEGVVLSLMDVTERKRAEQKVEREQARLRSILDAMPDGVYIVNEGYDIEYANPVIEREFGAVRGGKCYHYLHDLDQVCVWCKNEMVFRGASVQGEWSSPKTGKVYEVFDTPLTNSDGSLSKLKLLHDISSRKQAEAELEHRNAELQSLSELERRQRQVAEMLRSAAQALSQSLDLDVVLRTLLTYLRSLIQANAAGVVFLEGEGLLGVRAVDGYDEWTDPRTILSIQVEGGTNPYFQRLIATQRSLLIPNTAEDPDWVDFPGTERIHSHLLVPIVVDGNVVGVVELGKFEAGYFTEDHIRWAEALVVEATVAIQNAWLFEQVRAGRERLQTLSRRLVEVQEKERVYIARELHDQASQTLTSLTLGLGMLEKEPVTPQWIRAKIAGLKDMTNHVLEELHRLAFNLRPASLDHLGLTPALEQFVRSFAQDTNLLIRLKRVGFDEDERLPQDVDTALFRIVQEALTNVARHAQARRADVVLERRGDSLLVIIEDDGIGFDVNRSRETGHLGLLGMEERAEMLGGTLVVESVPGRGTTLVVEVPYAHQNIAGG